MPVYFLSIGGPNFIGNKEHPAYSALAAVGEQITTKVKPKAVVVFSAHWQGSSDRVLINVAKDAGIIYDFNGFPFHYYKIKYPYRGSPEVAEGVIQKLQDAGVNVDKVERGLDHGVWVGFLAAFNPGLNPLSVPIVQVSLFDSEGVDQHYRLGEVLQGLRDEGILIIGAGMAVHNLRDFRAMRGKTIKDMPYATTFDDALKDAATNDPKHRQRAMAKLMEREDARLAHPTLEHLLPMYVVAGAAGGDVGERLYTLAEGSLNWAQYRFGDVETKSA